MPEDTESLRRDCQVERESQGLDFAEKAHWCAIWSQGRGPGRGNDYWQCHQGICERHRNDIRYGRHLQGGQSGNRVQLWCRGEQCRFWIHVFRGRQLQRLRGERAPCQWCFSPLSSFMATVLTHLITIQQLGSASWTSKAEKTQAVVRPVTA